MKLVTIALDLDALRSLGSASAFRAEVLALARTELHRVQKREQGRRWRRRHPDKVRHRRSIARARARGATGSHTLAEWLALIEKYEGRCASCGIAGEPLLRSRIVPPTHGGSNDIGNILPRCRPCSSRHWNGLARSASSGSR